MGALGVGLVAWPLVNSMNPDASVQAVSATEVDLSGIAEGQTVTLKWRGKPVFVRNRTAAEIESAKATPMSSLIDPQPDADRVRSFDKVLQEKWVVVVGVCTHLGCVPIKNQGDFDGWYCPCHGSHYDNAGRMRKGPAPRNLEIPAFAFLSPTKVRIG